MSGKKQSKGSLFLSVFLKAVVIILGVVIIGLAVALTSILIKNKNNKKTATEEATVDESVFLPEEDEEASFTTPTDTTNTSAEAPAATDDVKNLKVIVLNASGMGGVAGTFAKKLSEDGFTNITAANYLPGLLEKTTICISDESQRDVMKAYYPDAEVKVGTLGAADTDADLTDAKIIVIIGVSDAN